MRENIEIVRKFERAISATWIYTPIAMRKAAVAIKALVNETTDDDERAMIEAYAALLERRAKEKEANYRAQFGG
jgi:hypothetical protein